MASETQTETYYVPEQSKLPIWMAIGMATTVTGAALWMNGSNAMMFLAGCLVLAATLYQWFSIQITENHQGLAGPQLKRSYVWGMGWFIFSEVMFFAAFFGALYYIRGLNIHWLAGEGAFESTQMLYDNFTASWPLMSNPDNSLFPGPEDVIHATGLPLINTILLLASSITLTISHHALIAGKRKPMQIWLGVTILLGLLFLYFQAIEYHEAYTELGLTLNSGIYGTTFFMLTGFHGAHVTIGTFMLIVMFFRGQKGHFKSEDHFGFQAAAWYWHFVDVVWVCLFILVYWI
jgi:cytochrome c oxidase subunit 3